MMLSTYNKVCVRPFLYIHEAVCTTNGKRFFNKRHKTLRLLLHQAEKLDVHVHIQKFISVRFKV